MTQYMRTGMISHRHPFYGRCEGCDGFHGYSGPALPAGLQQYGVTGERLKKMLEEQGYRGYTSTYSSNSYGYNADEDLDEAMAWWNKETQQTEAPPASPGDAAAAAAAAAATAVDATAAAVPEEKGPAGGSNAWLVPVVVLATVGLLLFTKGK